MLSLNQNELDIRRATSVFDYLFLRSLRNSVRLNMTNSTTAIGLVQQLRFYFNQPANVEIYIARVKSRRVGYLLLRDEGPTSLVTEAVVESCRGAGIGTSMLRHAQNLRADLTAEILDDNVASIRLHQAAGFEFACTKGRVQIFRFRRATQKLAKQERAN